MVYIYFAKHILCKILYTYPILYDCPRKLRSCQIHFLLESIWSTA